MKSFVEHGGIAAALPMENVDTDKILSGQFLKTISREGLGRVLFHAMRYRDDGSEDPTFVLNRSPWREASILIALENFGCGSSREHAPWALADFGIRVIVAPSFADIFFNNCFKNGILPIVLPRSEVDRLMAAAASPDHCHMEIDLPAQTLSWSAKVIPFDVDPDRKRALLLGLDEIAATEEKMQDIERFEKQRTYIAPGIPVTVASLVP